MLDMGFEQLDLFVEGWIVEEDAEEGTEEVVTVIEKVTNPESIEDILEQITSEDIKSYSLSFTDHEAPFNFEFSNMELVFKMVEVLNDYDFNIIEIVEEYHAQCKIYNEDVRPIETLESYLETLTHEEAFYRGRFATMDSSDDYYRLDGYLNIVTMSEAEAVEYYFVHFQEALNNLDALGY